MSSHSLHLHTSRSTTTDHNVGGLERLISVAAGMAIAAYGIRRRGASGAATALVGAALIERGATGRCRVYRALGVNTAEGLVRQHGRNAVLVAAHAMRVERSVTIQRTPQELFDFWRDFSNLAHIMPDVESVTILSPTRSHWVVRGPGDTQLEWNAEVHHEVPGERIGWRTIAGSEVVHAGSVRFQQATGGRGTVVTLEAEYDPPGGAVARLIAAMFGGDPDARIREDLRRFKQFMEAGEVATTDGQSSGRDAEED